jgi:hypothetical protein
VGKKHIFDRFSYYSGAHIAKVVAEEVAADIEGGQTHGVPLKCIDALLLTLAAWPAAADALIAIVLLYQVVEEQAICVIVHGICCGVRGGSMSFALRAAVGSI